MCVNKKVVLGFFFLLVARSFCSWQRGTTTEGFAVEKIGSADFCFVSKGSCGSEVFLNLCLKGKYETIHYAMYSGRQSVYIKTRFDAWVRGMMRSSRGLESGQWLFSKVYVWVLFVFGFYCFVFQERVP